jgi:predicted ATPase
MHNGRVTSSLAASNPMHAPLIRQLSLHSFLSYGPKGVSVDLFPLNVLIGPNASGKSNLLEALSVLRATAGDLQAVIREGGGITEYLWKGGYQSEIAVLAADVSYPIRTPDGILEHILEIVRKGTRLGLNLEHIESRTPTGLGMPEIIYHSSSGETMLRATVGRDAREITTPEDLKPDQSVLSQRRDPERYPEITYLADRLSSIVLFQEWNFGRRTAARLPQPTDLPSDFLLPDASNLGLVLHDLTQTSAMRDQLITYLRRFYEPARYLSTKIQGGTIQLFVEEEGGRLIPATRLSDGTLRYLCLLAILCHPSPPPVIAIEEPELGLHPDILPTIAELLRKASERTQLFVTTHSDALVSALSDAPESILVCEATQDGTTMKRLEAEPLREWLEKYSLGEIWRMGEIGGNRW